MTGLGNFDHSEWDELEGINAAKESVRIAAAAGCSALASNKVIDIEVEDFDGNAQSAAEGDFLYDKFYGIFFAKYLIYPYHRRSSIGFAQTSSISIGQQA